MNCSHLTCSLLLQESSTLEAALLQQATESLTLKRHQPYILRIGSSLFLIADGKPIAVQPSSVAVAVDTLMKLFYVFNVNYPLHTRVVHNFIQHMVLNLECRNLTARALKMLSELSE
jgi:hypothetical protein